MPLRPVEEARWAFVSYTWTELLGSVLAGRSQAAVAAAAAVGVEAATYGFTKTASGLEYSDVKLDEGPKALAGKSVQFQWVLRRSNGYFVDASSNYGDVTLAISYKRWVTRPKWATALTRGFVGCEWLNMIIFLKFGVFRCVSLQHTEHREKLKN